MPSQKEQYFAIKGASYLQGSLVLTCEHATNIVPPPLQATEEDQHWLAQHWGWDIGIENVTTYLVEVMQSVGIFSRFSRLVCDPNRGVENPTWIVQKVEGYELSFNQKLSKQEKQRRKRTYHDPYHQAVSNVIDERTKYNRDLTLLSMHSFTPCYIGQVRTLEMGVLFDENYQKDAEELAAELGQEGFLVELNQPYSGMNGMMYSIHRHGNESGMRYIELEIRQDLIDTKEKAIGIAKRLEPAFQRWLA